MKIIFGCFLKKNFWFVIKFYIFFIIIKGLYLELVKYNFVYWELFYKINKIFGVVVYFFL